jgi:WD40 repeat protein
LYAASSIGFPASYKVADVNNDGVKELVATAASNNYAACFIFKSSGSNQYNLLSTINETDPNTMTCSDIKILSGDIYPSILLSSFGGKVYVYQYNGSNYIKQFEKLDYPGSAIQRVYWVNINGSDGYFNTWSSTSSNGNYYIFKRTIPVGIISGNENARGFKLFQNYPNPFNPRTVIGFELKKAGDVKIKVYSITGCEVFTLVNQRQTAGVYEVDMPGIGLSSGVYFYSLLVDNKRVDSKSMVLIK